MKSTRTHNYPQYGWGLVILLFILILAAYLRLVNIEENPGWYSDEGTQLNIALNLLDGKMQYFAINKSTLLFAKLPVFSIILAGLLGLFGGGIVTLRSFTAVLGILSVGLLYFMVYSIGGEKRKFLAPLSSLILAIYPQSVLYNRLGFSYNLLTPIIIITLWTFWIYLATSRKSWLAISSFVIGLGGATDLMIWTIMIPLFLLVVFHRRQDCFIAMSLMLLPIGLYASYMLLTAPQAFYYDLLFTFFRIGGYPLIFQLPAMLINFGQIITYDYWIAFGTLGLFLLEPGRFRNINLFTLFIPTLILCRTISLSGLGFYYFTPLLPILAIGFASLIIHITPLLMSAMQDIIKITIRQFNIIHVLPDNWIWKRILSIGTSLGIFIIILNPMIISTFMQLYQVTDGYQTGIDDVLINANDTKKGVDYVNMHLHPSDVVIASPAIAWLVQGNSTDFQQAIAATHKSTQHLPADIPSERFSFDPRLENARYVIIDNIWRNWAVLNMPEVDHLANQAQTWPLVYKSGEIMVYENPDK